MSEIRINVLLFGACREAAGAGEFRCELSMPADVANAWAEIKRLHPELERFERSALFAVNEEHVLKDQRLKDGDTVAIFPPVSGG